MFILKKKIHLSLYELLSLATLIIIVSLIIFYSIYIANHYLQSTPEIVSAFVGAGGNFSGGVLGGIVAYIVAAYQINNSKNNEDIKTSKQISTLLILIKAELNHNKKVITKCKDDFDSGNNLDLLKTISTEAWNRGADRLGEKVGLDTIESLINCNALIQIYKTTSPSIDKAQSDKMIDRLDTNIKKIDDVLVELSK